MKKAMLAALPERISPQHDYPKAFYNEWHHKNDQNEGSCFCANIHTLDGMPLLLLHIYRQIDVSNGDSRAIYRVYIAKDQYITQVLQPEVYGYKETWVSAAVINLKGQWGYNIDKRLLPRDQESLDAISQFYSGQMKCFNHGGIGSVVKHQQHLMNNRIEAKRQKIRDRVDAQMAKVPELPTDFMQWLEDEAMKKNFIFFEPKAGRKPRRGYCSRCKMDAELSDQPKHNAKCLCSLCGASGTYKAAGRGHGGMFDFTKATIILKTNEGGLAVRDFEFLKEFMDFRNPKYKAKEYGRSLYTKDKLIGFYEYVLAFETREHRWMEIKFDNSIPESFPTDLYMRNWPEVFKGTSLEYAAENGLFVPSVRKGYCGDFYGLDCVLYRLFKYNMVESLIKIGMKKIANAMLDGQNILVSDGKKLHHRLMVEKRYFDYLRQQNSNSHMLSVFQKLSKHRRYISISDAISLSATGDAVDKLILLSAYHSVKKILDFYDQQKGINSELYLDYIEMANKLKYDLSSDFVAFPRHVQKAHDAAVDLLNAKSSHQEDGQYKKLYLRYKKKFSYTADGFSVIVPQHIMNIVKEGHHLRHCVGGYAGDVISGRTIILFVRRSDDEDLSYFTMEVRPESFTMRQCRGYRNCDMPDDVKAFVDSYMENVLSSLSQRRAG